MYIEREWLSGVSDIAISEFDEVSGQWSMPYTVFEIDGKAINLDGEGENLVFETDVNGNWDIGFFHPPNLIEFVDTNPAEDRNPVITSALGQWDVFWESNRDGTWKIYHSQREVVGVEPNPTQSVPESFIISVHPNPGNAEFRMDLELPVSGEVEAAIYDLSGRRVAMIHDGVLPAGLRTLSWDASDITSGIYLLRVESADNIQTRKMVVLK